MITTFARKLYLTLPLLALLVSGCTAKNINPFSPSVATKHTVKPAPAATVAPPNIAINGFDTFAGNCPDAANEDAALVSYASSQNYNFDMQLQIKPTQGCDADPKSSTYKTFRRQVSQATLTLNALDTAWVYGYVSTRDTFLTNVFSQLQAQYPSLSTATISVTYGDVTRATLTYSGHGAPAVNDLYAQ